MAEQPSPKKSGHFHAVRFYPDSDSLAELVAEFVGESFLATLPAIVIATPGHRELILKHLRARSFDVERLQANDDLILVDAETLLREFIRDGMPNRELFRQAMVPMIERSCGRRPGCVIRAYGEMVDVLWKAGHTVAATRLEMLWNQLAQSHTFSLLCGYAMGNFYKDAAQEDICSHHTHVLSAGSTAGLAPQ